MGGMLNYVRNIIPEMIKYDEWEMDIWGGTKDKENVLPFEIDGKQYNYKSYTIFHTSHKVIPNFMLSFCYAIKNAKKFDEYDVIYSHTSATTIALKLTHPGKCVIHHQHGLSYKDNKGFTRIYNIGYTIAQLLADSTLFVASDKEVENHKKSHYFFKNRDFYPIGSPIDFNKIQGAAREIKEKQNDILRFIYVGRIDGWKNIELLVDSFNLYLKSNKKAVLTIIGEGPQFNYINKKISLEKLQESIKLVGRKNFDEIITFLLNSDIFLFPTKGEGVSLALLEAFSAGLPAVVFDVTGVRNFVMHNKTGIVVKKMTVNAYVNGIIKLAGTYKNMIGNCLEIAEEYNIDKIANQIINYIYEAMYKCGEKQ